MHVFTDDSDTFGKNGFICLAGFISSDYAWEKFSQRWCDKLDEHGMSVLHTSDFLAGEGEYRELSHSYEDRLDILSEFMDIIRDEIDCGIFSAINAGEYRNTLKDAKKKLKPEEFLFRRILRLSFDYMASEEISESLGFWIDDSEKTSSRFLSIWSKTKKHWKGEKSMLGSIAFGDDQALPPLQAADVFANVMVRAYASGLDPWHGKSPFNRMFIHPKTHAVSRKIKGEFWDAKNLIRLKDGILEMAKPRAG
ncbi:DUF3800 domain-containing protein [Erythrobacter sp.]|uniref:DUF3800 domain-containing protein n=1 Tax=Erythrobacter sp. TaxID=1042 RepID=UPI001425FAFF|nr:DUF3800 domain-containing protein [Erythrobacter sp.]QIQ85295.1 MAG: DUF3800 domain-containing protein [Erythrobacter sp.]